MNKTAFVVCAIAILVAGCGEQPIKPESPAIDFKIPVEARVKLTDNVRKLLEEIENGHLSGADAATVQRTLEEATEITKTRTSTRLVFAADGHQGDLEGHPVIYVIVQNKFNRVIKCGVVIPCW